MLSSLAEFKLCWPSLSDKHTELTVKNGMPAEASASVTHARNGISACVKGDRPPPLFFMSGYGPAKDTHQHRKERYYHGFLTYEM